MKLLFFGDIFGRPGREGLAKIIPELRKKYNPDVIGANVENLAHGHGLTKESLNELISAGVDFFTSGNHVWEGQDSKELLERKDLRIARPANYPPGVPGRGFYVLRVGIRRLLVINLLGRVFMRNQTDCPFRKADEILSQIKELEEGVDATFVDFHAEATSEKRLLGFYLDGKISAMVGTHTHVPTADEQILPNGTGYITDVGMCGALDSSLGIEKKGMIEEIINQVPCKKEVAEGDVEIGAILFDIKKDGKCRKIKRIRRVV